MLDVDACKSYADAARKEAEARRRLWTARYKHERCVTDVVNVETTMVPLRDAHAKAHEKLRKLVSLCANLQKTSAKSKADSDTQQEHARRAHLRTVFDSQLKDVSARIEQSSARKATLTEHKLQLNTQLQAVLDAYSDMEKQLEGPGDNRVASDLARVDDAMAALHEMQQMELEDYTTKVLRSIAKQMELRELITAQSQNFMDLQAELTSNNSAFEDYRRRITQTTDLCQAAKAKRVACSAALKPAAVDVKALSLEYSECVTQLEKEKAKRDKLRNLAAQLEADVS